MQVRNYFFFIVALLCQNQAIAALNKKQTSLNQWINATCGVPSPYDSIPYEVAVVASFAANKTLYNLTGLATYLSHEKYKDLIIDFLSEYNYLLQLHASEPTEQTALCIKQSNALLQQLPYNFIAAGGNRAWKDNRYPPENNQNFYPNQPNQGQPPHYNSYEEQSNNLALQLQQQHLVFQTQAMSELTLPGKIYRLKLIAIIVGISVGTVLLLAGAIYMYFSGVPMLLQWFNDTLDGSDTPVVGLFNSEMMNKQMELEQQAKELLLKVKSADTNIIDVQETTRDVSKKIEQMMTCVTDLKEIAIVPLRKQLEEKIKLGQMIGPLIRRTENMAGSMTESRDLLDELIKKVSTLEAKIEEQEHRIVEADKVKKELQRIKKHARNHSQIFTYLIQNDAYAGSNLFKLKNRVRRLEEPPPDE